MTCFLLLLEGAVMAFLLLLTCVVGIANGPVGMVYLYEQDVQDRVVELGLTTKEKIRRSLAVGGMILYIPVLFLTPAMVWFLNGARTFWDCFWQMTVILWIEGLFDRFFIDWYWVGHTKAWRIPGTEDLMPYIPKRTQAVKWLGTVVGFPVIAAAVSWVMTLF